MFYEIDNRGYKKVLEGVEMKTLVHGERTLLSEFKIAKGASIPLHQHPHEQTGYLVSGRLRFTIEGETLLAEAGNSWNLLGGTMHGAEALENSVVIEVFSPVREDYLPEPEGYGE